MKKSNRPIIRLLFGILAITLLGQSAQLEAYSYADFQQTINRRFPWVSTTGNEMKALYSYETKKVTGKPVSERETQMAQRAAKKIGISLVVIGTIIGAGFFGSRWWKGRQVSEPDQPPEIASEPLPLSPEEEEQLRIKKESLEQKGAGKIKRTDTIYNPEIPTKGSKIALSDALQGKLNLISGQITAQDVDVIVNAANENLSSGGGVCGQIFKDAETSDMSLQGACYAIGRCPTGQACITESFKLKENTPITHIIHAVGPSGKESSQKNKQLYSAYYNSLKLADEYGLPKIAFPLISSDLFGYDPYYVNALPLQAMSDYMEQHPETQIEEIKMMFYSYEQLPPFKKTIQK